MKGLAELDLPTAGPQGLTLKVKQDQTRAGPVWNPYCNWLIIRARAMTRRDNECDSLGLNLPCLPVW